MKTSVVYISLAAAVLLLVSACAGEVTGQPEPRIYYEDSVWQGRQLIANYGCGSCHRIPGVPGADAMAAPPLDNFYQRSFIAGKLPNSLDNLVAWIQDPQRFIPGNAMPNLGVNESDARNIAAYLYHRPDVTDLLHR
ncbi:MAG: cytochrome c [Anaerolineae bacterium]|nr:cytochrome c [Anaerolineae bacterium]